MLRAVKDGLVIILVLSFLTAAAVGIHILTTRYAWVAVAAVNLSAGMRLGEGMVALRVWSVATVPDMAIRSVADIRGKYVRENIARGEVVLPSSLTPTAPPPVRTTTKWTHILAGHLVPREDAANLFVGDKVDATIFRIQTDANGMIVRGVRGAPIETEQTLRGNWIVHRIEYENPKAQRTGYVLVTLEKNANEWVAAVGSRTYALRWPTRLVRSE